MDCRLALLVIDWRSYLMYCISFVGVPGHPCNTQVITSDRNPKRILMQALAVLYWLKCQESLYINKPSKKPPHVKIQSVVIASNNLCQKFTFPFFGFHRFLMWEERRTLKEKNGKCRKNSITNFIHWIFPCSNVRKTFDWVF